MPFLIDNNQSIGHRQDFRSASIIGFQANDLGIRPVDFESQDVLDFGSTPAVDGLVVISHNTKIAVSASQGFYNTVLAAIGILILVDEDLIKAAGFRVMEIVKLF